MGKGFYVLYGVLILLIGIIVSVINQPTNQLVGCATEGVVLDIDYPKTPEGIKGRQVFNANCAACHHLDRNMIGPSLRGIYSKYQKQNLNWHQFIVEGSDKRVLKDSIDWGFKCMNFPHLTEVQINQLAAFFE